MSFFSRLFGSDVAAPGSRDPSDDFWYAPARARAAGSNINVTVAAARRVPVVRDCLSVLSQTVSGLSFGVYEWLSNNQRRPLPDSPLMRLMLRPSRRDTPVAFFTNMVDDLATEGQFLAEILSWDRQGNPTELLRHEPGRFFPELLPDNSLRFKVTRRDGRQITLLEDEAWYIATPPHIDGFIGRSAIRDDGREAIGAMIALQNFSNAFWENDATPPFIITSPSHFKTPEDRGNFLKAWYQWAGGKNRGRPAVLEYGMDVKEMSKTNEQSQFIETRKELAVDVARIWRMPPHKVGILDKATFSNIEQQSLEFVVDTLMPWTKLIEQSAAHFFLDQTGQYFQFNLQSLLRGDTKARFESYARGRQWGWLSVNEIRAMENMNGIGSAGDRYIEPLNMVEAGSDRDAGRVEDTNRALRVLHQTVPAGGSISEKIERALDGSALDGGNVVPLLKVVGGS